jgi:polysaccharide export outer membrane protein
MLKRSFTVFLVLSAFAFAGAGCVSAQESATGTDVQSAPSKENQTLTEPEKAESVLTKPEPRILPGDVIFVEVKEAPDLTKIYTTNNKGRIGLGYMGDVDAEGLTPGELADKIKAKLEADYIGKATVSVEIRGHALAPVEGGVSVPSLGSVWVMGEVKSPGPVPIPPEDKEFTISKAIIKAGVADFAKLSKTKLVRKRPDGTAEIKIINVYDIIYKGKLEKDVPLQNDDRIIVPPGMFKGPS